MTWFEDFELESRKMQFGMVEELDMNEFFNEVENSETVEAEA